MKPCSFKKTANSCVVSSQAKKELVQIPARKLPAIVRKHEILVQVNLFGERAPGRRHSSLSGAKSRSSFKLSVASKNLIKDLKDKISSFQVKSSHNTMVKKALSLLSDPHDIKLFMSADVSEGFDLSAELVNNACIGDLAGKQASVTATSTKSCRDQKSAPTLQLTIQMPQVLPLNSIQPFVRPQASKPDALDMIPASLAEAMGEVRLGFEKGLKPMLTDEGTSGTYILRGQDQEPIGVFKPIDEEQFAPNNPRDYAGAFGQATFRAGVLSGEATLRELAAYLLDHDHFSGVPPTALASMTHESYDQTMIDSVHSPSVNEQVRTLLEAGPSRPSKSTTSSSFDQSPACSMKLASPTGYQMPLGAIQAETAFSNNDMETSTAYSQCPSSTQFKENYAGKPDFCSDSGQLFQKIQESSRAKIGSFQTFCQNQGPIENYSSDLFPLDEVHKIAVLDLRILNLDRNVCNILVQKDRATDQWGLVPIDHGLSLPDTLAVSSYEIAWLSFSQAEEPFSEKTLAYIEKLDVEKDIALLEEALPKSFRPVCLRNMRISSTLLKTGAKHGLTLAQIGEILCRPDEDDEELSPLEAIVEQAEARMKTQRLNRIRQETVLSRSPAKQTFLTPSHKHSDLQSMQQNLFDCLCDTEDQSNIVLGSDEHRSPSFHRKARLLSNNIDFEKLQTSFTEEAKQMMYETQSEASSESLFQGANAVAARNRAFSSDTNVEQEHQGNKGDNASQEKEASVSPWDREFFAIFEQLLKTEVCKRAESSAYF